MPRNWPGRLPRAGAERPGRHPRRKGRLFCLVLSLAVSIWCLYGAARAQEYPLVSVSVALPAPMQSQDDQLFSLLFSFLGRYSNQPFVTERLAGRAGSYAVASLLNKDANGYALAVVTVPAYLLLPQSRGSMFTYGDLSLINVFAYVPTALWVAQDSPFTGLADLVKHVRDNPEQEVVAGAGSFTEQQMAAMIFDRAAGVKTLYMPLLGSAECRQAVLEKRAAACWGLALRPGSMPGMRALAVAGPERSPALPDVPTFKEAGLDVINGRYYVLALSGKTKDAVKAKAAEFYGKAFADGDLAAGVARLGFYPMNVTVDRVPAFLREQAAYLDSFLDAYPGMFPRGEAKSILKAIAPQETETP